MTLIWKEETENTGVRVYSDHVEAGCDRCADIASQPLTDLRGLAQAIHLYLANENLTAGEPCLGNIGRYVLEELSTPATADEIANAYFCNRCAWTGPSKTSPHPTVIVEF